MPSTAERRPLVSAGLAADDDELQMLRASARGVFARPSWPAIAEAGLLALLTPEASGGAGFRPLEACVVAEEAGRAMVGIPWAASLVAAAALAGDAHRTELVGRLMAGSASAALAPLGRFAIGDAPGAHCEVDAAGEPTAEVVVLIPTSGSELFVLDTSSTGVGLDALGDALDTTRAHLHVDFARAELRPARCTDPRRLIDAAVLLGCADTLGVLTSNVELLVDYLTEREAFGRPIASFQAIQHRLVDHTTLVAAAAALIRRAAVALGAGNPASGRLVAAAHCYLDRRASDALDDLIQLSGGIGFTWEWPIHHGMRRAVVNATTPRSARSDLDVLVVDAAPAAPDHPEHAAFRDHVRAVIADSAPFVARQGHRAPTDPTEEAALRRWYAVMFDQGLIGANWPEAWGGRAGHHPLHDLIVNEELLRARAPQPIDQVELASQALLRFGTEQQKSRHLPRIRRGEEIWCQLFSEPDAGSDLAGLRARAELAPGGTWRLSGQKTWTTDGHWAQFGLALLRTGVAGTRHDGITAFIVPIDAPGLEVRPIRTIGGAHEFNEVFLDDVVIDADSVLGEIGGGWALAMSALEAERFGVAGNVVLLDLLLADLRTVADAGRSVELDDVDRDGLGAGYASLAAEAAAAAAFVAEHVERTLAGSGDEGDAPIAKILYTEAYNRIARHGVRLVQDLRPMPPTTAAAAQRLEDAWLWSRALTISGGSSEVMRNIVAKRRLRLPHR